MPDRALLPSGTSPATIDHDQVFAALARANAVRVRRAQILRDIAAGHLAVTDTLEEQAMASCTVYRALCAQPRWGRRRALRHLHALRMSEALMCGSLTERQRAVLGVGG